MSIGSFVGKIIFTSVTLASWIFVQSEIIESKIVGGYNVSSWNGFRHQVSIRAIASDQVRYGNGHRCGGSLIDPRTVLTAAHCVHDGKKSYLKASNFVIAMGSLERWKRDNNTLYINAIKVVGHKKFNPTTFDNDIALIKLAQEVPFNHPTVQPIARSIRSPTGGESCQISGWGTTQYENGIQPNLLMAVNLTINPRTVCNQKNYHNGDVLKGMFCAGPFAGPNLVDSCQGDSGGPLTCNGVLVGITSNGKGCALANYPGVYIDVFYYEKWIATGGSTILIVNLIITMISAIINFV